MGTRRNSDAAHGPGVTYQYDVLDHLTTATRGSVGSTDITTTLTYDDAGRKTSMSDPDMGSWSYAYDTMGNLIEQTDAKGQVECLYYDALNRLTGKYYTNIRPCPASPTYNVAYQYDEGGASANAIGRRTSMYDASGSTSWTYDARGQVTSETQTITNGGTFLTQWGYNNADLVTSMIYPDGEVVTNDYNSQMLPAKVYNNMGTPNNLSDDINYAQSILYDSAGRVTSRALGNTLTQTYDYYTWDGYDNHNIQHPGSGGRLEILSSSTLQKSWIHI